MNRTLALNPLIAQVKESATLDINQQVKRLKSLHKNIVHFGFGESPFPVPKDIKESLIKYSDSKTYLPGEGLPELRKAIAQYYQSVYDYSYTSDDVFVAPGSKESLFQLLYLLEGDLILPGPSWVSYEPQAKLLGKKVHRVLTNINNHYCLTAIELEKLCHNLDKNRQKILILNSPNNPTGCCLSQQNYHDLALICKTNNIVVISDEIYAGTEYQEQSHTSMVYEYPEKTIVTAGLSKLFSGGGYRLGFSLIPNDIPELKKALTTLISETYSCVSAPIQYAAIAAYSYDQSVSNYVQSCASLHQLAGCFLYQEFLDMGLNCAKPCGAFYLMPDFLNFKEALNKQRIEDDKHLAQTLLNHYGVATLPGSDFGMPEDAFSLRIASVDYDGKAALNAYATDPTSVIEKSMPNLILGCKEIKSFINNLNS